MTQTYLLTAYAPKLTVQAALLAHDEIEDWDPELVVTGREIAEDKPDDWVLEGYYPRKPGVPEHKAISGLFAGKAPKISAEKLKEQNWLALSQQGVQPIRAGSFHIHTPDFAPDPKAINFTIPAAQAFGTGQHETTAGCLEMLEVVKRSGLAARRIADIGTGTGLLAFAAMHLWPKARATASDIDPVCADVVLENAKLNSIPIGSSSGALTMVIADGMHDPLLSLRGPYDLLMANILAGPLIDLAPDFAAAVAPKGSLVLAGLLAGDQENEVRRAYRRAGFRPTARVQRGDWTILWMRRRATRG
ncbi:MAG: 50S ribosomal protein L11 methyltransferase [Pseudomonadota bacterium]